MIGIGAGGVGGTPHSSTYYYSRDAEGSEVLIGFPIIGLSTFFFGIILFYFLLDISTRNLIDYTGVER